MKLSRRQTRWLISLCGLLFPLACYAWSFYAPLSPIEISNETTWLTEPVTDDGYLFYAKAHNEIAGDGVTKENNAAFDGYSWDAFRVPENYELKVEPGEHRDPHWLAVCEILGREEAWSSKRQPWSADDDPLGFDFLSLNQHLLNDLADRSLRTRYFRPLSENSRGCQDDSHRMQSCDLRIPEHRTGMSDFGDLFQVRAMFRFCNGDIDTGISDLKVLCRYRDLMVQQPGTIIYFDRFSEEIAALRCATTVSLLHPHAARKFLDFAESRPNQRSLDDCIKELGKWERLRLLGVVQYYHNDANNGFPDDTWGNSLTPNLGGLRRHRFTRRVDWNQVMRRLNRILDQWVHELQCERDGVAYSKFQPTRASVESIVWSDVKAAGTFAEFHSCTDAFYSWMLLCAVWPEQYLDVCDVELTYRRLARLAPRLAHWNLRHGIYPTRLEDLLSEDSLPPLHESVLIDPFTGRQFSYQLRKGGFLLYGLGKDRVDNPWGRYGKLDDVVVCWPLL